MKQFSDTERLLAIRALQGAFGNEFLSLDDHALRLVVQDFLEASLAAPDYAKNIGAGNLASYGETMKARERQGWDS